MSGEGTCGRCGARVWRAPGGRLYELEAEGTHWCGPGSEAWERGVERARAELDAERELLSECRSCKRAALRLASSPMLLDPETRGAHQCPSPVLGVGDSGSRTRMPDSEPRVPNPEPRRRRPATW